MTILGSTGFESGTLSARVPTNSTDMFTAGSDVLTGTCVYDDQHTHASTGRSAMFNMVSTGDGAYRHYTITAAATGAVRGYFYFSGAPNASTYFLAAYSGGTKIADVRIDTAGKLTMRDLNSATGGTSTASVASKAVRLEWLLTPNPTSGTMSLRIASGSNLESTTTFDQTLTGTLTGTSATTVDEIRVQIWGPTAGYSFWLDDYAVGNSTWIGPVTSSGGAVTVSAPPMESLATMPPGDTGDGVTIRPYKMGSFSDFGAGIATVTSSHSMVAAPMMRSVSDMGSPVTIGTIAKDGSSLIEMELGGSGVWVDVSALVLLPKALTNAFGRPTIFDPVAPATMTIVLDNSGGAFTPDNPGSTYYPNVVERIGFRVSYAKGGVVFRRFTGQVDAFSLDMSQSMVPVVVVTATDRLGLLGRRKMRSLYAETVLAGSGTGSDVVAYFDFTDAADSGQFANYGSPQILGRLEWKPPQAGGRWDQNIPPAYIQESRLGAGSHKSASPPTGIVIDGGLAFTSNGWNVGPPATNRQGPVLKIDNSGLHTQSFEFSMQSSDYRASTAEDSISYLSAYDSAGNWLLGLGIGSTPWGSRLYAWGQNAGQVIAPATSPQINDGNVHTIYVEGSRVVSGPTKVYIDDVLALTLSTSAWINATGFFLGGYGNPKAPGGAYQVAAATYGWFAMFSDAPGPRGFLTRLTWTEEAADRITRVLACCGFTDADWSVPGRNPFDVGSPLMGQGSRTRGTPMPIGQQTPGKTPLEWINEASMTHGGLFFTDPFGIYTYNPPGSARPQVPIVTIDMVGDVDSPAGVVWTRSIDNRPTKVTGNSAIGSVSLTTGEETDPTLTQEVTVELAAGTISQLQAAVSYRLNVATSRALRIKSLPLDLYTAMTAGLWNVLVAPPLGARIRVASMDSKIFGMTYQDYFIEGGSTTTSKDRTSQHFNVALELSPADDPPEAVWDDPEYGRWAADNLQLTTALDGVGTAATFMTLAGAPLTVDAGDYPLDLVIDAERVRLAAPVSGVVRTNLCANPDFELNNTGWAGFFDANISATVGDYSVSDGVRPWRVTGKQIMKVTVATVGSHFWGYPMPDMRGHGVAAWRYRVWIPSVNGVHDVFGGVFMNAADVDHTETDQWIDCGVLFTPSGATEMPGMGVGCTVAGQVFYLDAALIEYSPVMGDYFDGSQVGCAWTGAAHASTSTKAAATQSGVLQRGIPPTVPVPHLVGASVDVWHAANWAMG
jgi:hypothetical protein